MDSKERENFNRNSTLIVEHTKEGFTDLIELNTSLAKYASFEDFINFHQHDIYHLCYNRHNCCQCARGYISPNTRVLRPAQLEVLFPKNGPKKGCHNPCRTGDFCCCYSHQGLTTNVLDVTLARILLVKFCPKVFWYSCLTEHNQNLEDFLTQNKHHIYHLYDVNRRCCKCPPNYMFPTEKQVITKAQWNQLFKTSCVPCPQDRKRPAGYPSAICAFSVTSKITVGNLDASLSQKLIDHLCPLRRKVENLIQLRNKVFGHVNRARMSENDYGKYRYKIERDLLSIAKLCKKESEVKQKLENLDRRTLDGTLLMQSIKDQWHLQESFEEEVTRIEKHIDEKMENMDSKLDNIQNKVENIPDQVKVQADEKRKKLLDGTKNMIRDHIGEETFVKTDVVNKALDCVTRNGIVILIGAPGIGKSRIGLELLRLLSMNEKIKQSILLDDISQWQEMSDGMDAVFIDDVFGKTNCSYNENIHSKLLDLILATIHHKNIKVILTLRKNIYYTIVTITDRQRIFHDTHVLDLSSVTNQMTLQEKKLCLMGYLTKNRIFETEDIQRENISDNSILDPSTTVYLHQDTLNKILHFDAGLQIGFSETCYLFASHRKLTKQGHNFFCHPTEQLANEIDNLRTDGDANKTSMIDFILLVYILLNGDFVNIYNIDPKEFLQLMETMYLTPLSYIPKHYINDSAKRLLGKYLKISNEGHYCFQHKLISEAVLLSYSVADTSRVIPLLGFDFIIEMARPQFYQPTEGEVIFPVGESCYGLLAQRLLYFLETDYRNTSYQFVQNLYKSKIFTMTSNNILREMVNYLNQSLYDNTHNTVTPESASKEIKACVITLNLAICTLDVEKSNKILKILKYYNIKQNSLSFEFCNNIVLCQGLPGVQLLYNLHDSGQVFNITSLLGDVFLSFSSNEIYIDDNMKQFITSVTQNKNYDKSLVRRIAGFLCKQGQLDFVKFVLEKFDNSLFNVANMIIEACRSRNTEVIQWLVEKYKGFYNVQMVLNRACFLGYMVGVQIICDKFGHTELDMKSIMTEACGGGYMELVKWLCENFDINLFDMKTAMNEACCNCNTLLVKWLCEKFDTYLFDMKTAMERARRSGSTELVKWLYEKFDKDC